MIAGREALARVPISRERKKLMVRGFLDKSGFDFTDRSGAHPFHRPDRKTRLLLSKKYLPGTKKPA
jgi:hypothetical protein